MTTEEMINQLSPFDYFNNPPNPTKREPYKNSLSRTEIDKLDEINNKLRELKNEKRKIASHCNHRTIEGYGDALSHDTTGMLYCKWCGAKFKQVPMDIDIDILKDRVDGVIDAIQTIKIMNVYVPMSDELKQLYEAATILEDLPEMFKDAAENLRKCEMRNFTQ